jgi:hypothetical protein
MDEKIAQQVLDELFPSLEALDTQSTAILKFLKDKGIGSDEELAPYFEEAGKASDVRWRAARLRMNGLIASAVKDAQRNAEKESAKGGQKAPEPAVDTSRETAQRKEMEGGAQGPQGQQGPQKSSDESKPQEAAGKTEDQNKKERKPKSNEDAGETAA